jgi:hypothetical protein
MPRDKEKKPKETRGVKTVRKATKKQRRQISKSGKPKGEENKPTLFQFFRSERITGDPRALKES